ncbi:hypothetical protein OG976_08535 [Mycobacterium sp. NBC_00419]|uniref:hypothetical protein n=1 Tax=Mycobacterium sp. NBC_00419 TaxID=2975989 RepID=UPI002E1C2B6F
MHVIKFRGVHHLRLGVEGGVLAEVYVAEVTELVKGDYVGDVDPFGIKSPGRGVCGPIIPGETWIRPMLPQN